MRSRVAEVPRRRTWSIAALLILALGACASEEPDSVATGDGPRADSRSVTNANGSYRVTLLVGTRAPGATPPCAPGATPGSAPLRVVVSVANESADRPAPFPPLRVELVGAGGSPAEVSMQESSGACTFTPRVSAIEAEGSVSFTGSTPPIADTTPAGGAGVVQVSISENDFSLSVPVP